MQRLQIAGITLNVGKCEFGVTKTKFLSHVIDESRIRADPDKTKAIMDFPIPSNRRELRRFFEIVNYLGKFSPQISSNTRHLQQLLGNNVELRWGPPYTEQFNCLKTLLVQTPVLMPYCVEAETLVSADSSSYGLGAAVFAKSQW